MKCGKSRKITDDMIGMDERVCSCASRVVDMIIAQDENTEGRIVPEKGKPSSEKPKRTRKVNTGKR